MSDIPPDLIPNILCRLPVKSLLKFRCVSKSWKTLIDGPDFIKKHLTHSLKTNTNINLIFANGKILFLALDQSMIDLEQQQQQQQQQQQLPPLKYSQFGTKLLGSCNGLLCICTLQIEIAIWNPSIRRYHLLPYTNSEARFDFTTAQTTTFGFGHDPVNDDYKVVMMIQAYGRVDSYYECEFKVYSLKANSWRRIMNVPNFVRFLDKYDDCLSYKHGCSAYVGGALHWLVTRKRGDKFKLNLIVAFDLGIEVFCVVPQPEFVDKSFDIKAVGVLGGCLYMICEDKDVGIDVWVMKEYGVKESWTKLFSVAQGMVVGGFGNLRPMVYSKNGQRVLLEQNSEKLYWYDLKRKRVENVTIHGAVNTFDMNFCVESLVPLNGGIKINEEMQQAGEDLKKWDDFLSEGFKLVL